MSKRNIKIVIFMVISIILFCLVLFMRKQRLYKTEYFYSYNYNNESNSIDFFKTSYKKELLNSYKCKSNECYIYSKTTNVYFFDKDSKTILIDDGNTFIYDFVTNDILTDYYDDMYDLKKDNAIMYYVTTKNNLFGIIDRNGKVLIPNEYEYLDYEEKYDVIRDCILAKLNNKYGVINISTGNKLLDFEYDDINLTNDGFEVTKDGERLVISE